MAVRILHVTDCHLMTDPAAEIRGVRVRDTFDRVLAAVDERYADADRLVITGDLTHDERLTTYQLLRERLSNWTPRLRVVPGNHDDRRLLRDVFGDRLTETELADHNVFIDEAGGWRLIGLDSHVPGKLHGELGSEQLAWLTDELDRQPDRPACLFLHHPPTTVRSAWLDRIGLEDAEEFHETIRLFPQVRAVLCGHIHQERTVSNGWLTLLATPSTGVQFRPETETLEVDSLAPGFRIVDLHADGRFESRVERIGG